VSRSIKASLVKIGETNRKFSNFSAPALSSRRAAALKPSFTRQMSEKNSFRASGFRPSGGGGRTFDHSFDNGGNRLSEEGNSLSEKDKIKPDRRRQNVEISNFADSVNRIVLYFIKNKGKTVFSIIALYLILLFFSAIFRR